jgi:hypothetical protein
MRKKVQLCCTIIICLSLALGFAQRFSARAHLQESAAKLQLLAAFDVCIQQRFKDIDKTLGLRRIIKIGETPHRFKPENAKELTSMSELQNGGFNVALYLASRSVFGEKPEAKKWRQDNQENGSANSGALSKAPFDSRRLIKGPVLITAKNRDDLPMPVELWEQSRKAMQAFATKDSYEFTLGKWKFLAKPVRASESCLQCHLRDSTRIFEVNPKYDKAEPLKIGDPLGTVLYAYQESK